MYAHGFRRFSMPLRTPLVWRNLRKASVHLGCHRFSHYSVRVEPCGNHGLICLNSGTCLLDGSDQGTPICQCLPGFAGDDCSAVSCGSDGGACFNGGRCNEATGTCICPPPLTSDDCRGSRYFVFIADDYFLVCHRCMRCWNREYHRLSEWWDLRLERRRRVGL